MKLGIITFHRPINYGAILQTFALSKKLDNLNIENEVIDYRNEVQEMQINNTKYKTAKGIKNKIKTILFGRALQKKEFKFRNFLKSNIRISKKIYTKNNIEDANNEYDIFLTGSDQVWNLDLTGMDYNYFLKFVKNNNKKNSYASSFGYSAIPELYKSKCKDYLESYKNLGIREQQGNIIINDLLGKEGQVVLDPTLLLTKSEWEKFEKKPNIRIPEKYILLYAVSPTKYDYEIAKKIAQKEKMKIILINYKMMYTFGMKNCLDIGPEEFIWLIHNASLIITNSFHGTAFSIIFNKPFFVRLSTKKNNGNSRIENLINIVGLEDRYIKENEYNNNNIDWNETNKKINFKRIESVEYLKKCLDYGRIDE